MSQLTTDWKTWPLSQLGVTPSLIAACAEDGITTIGEVLESPDYQEDDEVVQAMGRFYEAHPEYAEQEEEQADNKVDLIVKHYQKMCQAGQRAAELRLELLAAKQRLAEVKKRYDAANDEYIAVWRRGPDPQREFDFVDAETDDELVDGEFEVIDWEKVAIGPALGLTAKQEEKLHEAGITTMGEFENIRGGAGLMSIHGIGRALADQLEDRALQWLDDNRDHLGSEVIPLLTE